MKPSSAVATFHLENKYVIWQGDDLKMMQYKAPDARIVSMMCAGKHAISDFKLEDGKCPVGSGTEGSCYPGSYLKSSGLSDGDSYLLPVHDTVSNHCCISIDTRAAGLKVWHS